MSINRGNRDLNIYYNETPARVNINRQIAANVTKRDQKYQTITFDFKRFLQRLYKIEQIPETLIAYFISYRDQKSGNDFVKPFDSGDVAKISNIVNGYNHTIKNLSDEYGSLLQNFNRMPTEFVKKVQKIFENMNKGLEKYNAFFRMGVQADFIKGGDPRFTFNNINLMMREILDSTKAFISKFSKILDMKGGGLERDIDIENVDWRYR